MRQSDPSIRVPTMRREDTALRCMATMTRVRVKVMAEHATDHRSADTDWGSNCSSFTTSTTEPSVTVENTRKATHCAKRGDLVSDMMMSCMKHSFFKLS